MNIIKNNKWITALVLCGIASFFGGCEKFLDQKPGNSLTREDFFKTEADANAAIIGVYDALQLNVDEFLNWGESRADLVTAVTPTGTDATAITNALNLTDLYDHLFDITKPVLTWDHVYLMIARANTVIEAVPEIPSLDQRFTQQESDAIVGEALFLRALGYFYLVKTFDEVPLMLEAPANDEVDYRLPKSSASTILDQIEADLILAEKMTNADYTSNDKIRGRVTKGAVNALQTDVFLWRAKYAEAAAAAKKVIDNNALYSLMTAENWFNMFGQKNSRESIFEVQFDFRLNENNSLKGVAGSFELNNTLYTIFTQENDLVRGIKNTFVDRGNGRSFWKYHGLNNQDIGRPTNDPNFIVYRLADVILMRAEALAHLGVAERNEALVLINQIRVRAGLDPFDDVIDPDTGFLVDVILNERAMELAMEGKRWFDLLRVAKNDGRPEVLINKVLLSRPVGDRKSIRARIIDPRGWYLPISQNELNKNPNLVQTSYYR
ncbi:RagB/SusD family nutrient uptake outer membrane protein [Pedobacter sp. P351]|uniref:RagB/SusD family nutrient uptake outer membrane protein n=1 Tax=Pedobacter superstes TaxID=3133441 RepID=UPI0030B2B315